MKSVRKKAQNQGIPTDDIFVKQFDVTQDYKAFLFVDNLAEVKPLLKEDNFFIAHKDQYKSFSLCLHLVDSKLESTNDNDRMSFSKAKQHIKIYNKTIHPLFACASVK